MIYPPPTVVEAEVHARLPDALRRPVRTEWADTNRGGEIADSFLEGPTFDRDGGLYVCDIPHGRVLHVDAAGGWDVVAEYDGWPNGLVLHRDGRVLVADYRTGIVELDPATGHVAPLLRAHRSESFKGVNDLHLSSTGELWFTDQGQTGLQDPTGRVFRWTPGSAPIEVLDTAPSPNGLVLGSDERQLYLAVTRANAIWRLPLTADGSASKVGLWIQLSGGLAGPDGLALDDEGGLVVAHVGTGVWRFDPLGRPTHVVDLPGAFCTNVAFGGPDGRTLVITDSGTGTVWSARMPCPGRALFGLS